MKNKISSYIICTKLIQDRACMFLFFSSFDSRSENRTLPPVPPSTFFTSTTTNYHHHNSSLSDIVDDNLIDH